MSSPAAITSSSFARLAPVIVPIAMSDKWMAPLLRVRPCLPLAALCALLVLKHRSGLACLLIHTRDLAMLFKWVFSLR